MMMMMRYLRANAVDLEVSPGGECSESEAVRSSKCWHCSVAGDTEAGWQELVAFWRP